MQYITFTLNKLTIKVQCILLMTRNCKCITKHQYTEYNKVEYEMFAKRR